jgi:hypothetical protein
LIPTAYWWKHAGYEIEIDVGHIEHIVLGKAVDHDWHFYGNKQQWEEIPEEEILDLDEGELEIHITVFSRWKGIVLLRDAYRIIGLDSGITVRRYE